MKKTLLLFAMLLGVVGAWAQRTMPTISDEPQNGEWAENTTWYTLKTKNGYYYETDLFLNTASKPTAADIAGNHKYQWCITGNETNGYKLYNRYQGASQFLASNKIASGTSDCYFTSEVQDKITTFKFRESTHGDAWWCLQLNGNTAEAYLARNGDSEKGNNLIAWQTEYNTAKRDGGAPITFEEVEDLPEISLTNVQPNRDQLTLYIDATTQTLTFSMDSPKDLGAKAKFAYVLHDGKYTFYNEASKSFLIWRDYETSNKGTMSSYNATYCDWSLTQSQQNGVTYFRMNSKRSNGTSDGTLNLLTSVGEKKYRFDRYGNTVAWEPGNSNNQQYSNLFTILINCSLYNEALGSTFQWTHSTPDIGVQPTITLSGIVGARLSDEVFDGGSEYSANITFPVPVSSETVANPTFISTYNYSIQAPDQFKWYASDNKIKVKEGEEIFSSSIASHLWLIYPKFNNGAFTFQIKNLATGLFINTEASGHDQHNDNSNVVLSATPTDYTVGQSGDEGSEFIDIRGLRLSVNSSEPTKDFIQTVGTYNVSHHGTALTFPDYMESTTWPEFVSTGTTLNPLVIAIDNDANKALVAKKLPSSADRYVHVTASNEEPELGYGQWTVYPAFSGNKIGFKIKNIATDTYIYAKPNDANEEYPVVLDAEGTIFDFADSKFAYTDGANTLYLSVPTNESYNLPLGVSTEADDTRKTIIFPEFNSYQVTIGEVGYTTLYSPFTVFAFPEEGKEVDIYAITDITTSENNKVTLTKLESWNVIPANQGCILKGAGKITFSKTDDTWVSGDWSTNLLRGSFTNTYVLGDAYVLSAPEGVESVGLYKALLNKDANGEAGTSHFKNNAGKAYLPAPADTPAAVRFFLFGFGDGEETGITETENGKVITGNTVVYDLAGRRVQGAQKGIFIVNGKKVVR